ncbi:MAG: EamA family transporter [Clostridia bacterium]|nr:EamA family transporter [Clostridia bacterium]
MEKTPVKVNIKLFGVIAVILSSMCYGITPSLTSIIQGGGIEKNVLMGIFGESYPRFLEADAKNALSSTTAVTYTMLFGLISAFLILLFKKKAPKLKVRPKKLVSIGFLGGGAYFLTLLFMSFSYLSMDNGAAVVLHSTHMVLAVLFGALIFREGFSIQKLIALVLSFFGIYLVSSFGGVDSFLGPLFALLSAVTYATYFLAGKYAYSDIDSFAVTFYINASAFIIGAITALIEGALKFPGSFVVFIAVALKGLIGGLFGVLLMQYGIRALGAGTSSMLSMLEPVIATLVGVFIWNERVSLNAVMGCVLIILSSLLLIFFTISIHSSHENDAQKADPDDVTIDRM